MKSKTCFSRFPFFSIVIFLILFSGGCKYQMKTKLSDKNEIIERKVDSLLSLMTLDEKIGQMVLYTSNLERTGPAMPSNYMEDIKNGRCGNIFNAFGVAYTHKLQEMAVKESRLGIPLLFGYDILHGYRTIFPIPLGEASSWDLEAIRKSARASAVEGTASGVNWTYSPMVDIARDPRWGRIAEGAGEDPFLGSAIAAARVKGLQNDDLSLPTSILACVKHFAAYGAPLAGRDYNTVDMSVRTLRGVYLPPYKAAIDAGALTVMSAFNDLNDIPATANHFILTDILRNDWKFKGFVVTDYTAINELIPHGVAANDTQATELALNAGVDMDMQGSEYHDYLKGLVEQGKIPVNKINQSVRSILKVKYLLGLFDDPYRSCTEKREHDVLYTHMYDSTAHDVACKSLVLLKNDANILPLKKGQKLAIIGPLADSKKDLLGCWKANGESDSTTPLLDALIETQGKQHILFSKGCDFTGTDTKGYGDALRIAGEADVIIAVMGEPSEWCGEAASRTSISIPDIQTQLLGELSKLKKPLVLVLMNGRPLALVEESKMAGAILETWYAGSMGAKAIVDVLFGNVNPSGKLTVSFPRNVGQVPIFYSEMNTGRPYNPKKPDEKYVSRYIDCPNSPLYPFGYGLSYTKFNYANLKLDKNEMKNGDKIKVTVDVTNSGDYDGEEVVQLYIRDMVASVTRPVKELRGFTKIFLKKGETKTVSFEIGDSDLAFYRKDWTYGTEPGDFKIFVGGNSKDVLEAPFKLLD